MEKSNRSSPTTDRNQVSTSTPVRAFSNFSEPHQQFSQNNLKVGNPIEYSKIIALNGWKITSSTLFDHWLMNGQHINQLNWYFFKLPVKKQSI